MRAWLPVLLWMLVIFLGSTDLLSSQRTSRFLGPFLRWLNPDISAQAVEQVQFLVRKTGHLAEYAFLGLLLRRAILLGSVRERDRQLRAALQACALACLYALSDEIHQGYVPTRYGSGLDVLIDATGAVLGVTAAWAWEAFRLRRPGLGDRS